MSVDQVTEEIRAQLLNGARRRLRRERMRLWIGAAVAVIAAVAGLTTAVVRSHDSTRVTTVASPGDQAAFAVCDEFLSIRERFNSTDFDGVEWDALAARAAATDDAELSTLVARLRGVTGSSLSPADFEVMIAIDEHCKDIGSPNYNPRYVPIELGPTPAVDLRAYGEPQLFGPADKPPEGPQGPTPPVGRDLSPVQLGVTAQGGYVLSWSYAGQPSGTTSCLSYGSTSVLRLVSCVGQGNVKDGELFRGLQTTDRMTTLPVPVETSFVVIESSSDRYVQRPAAQTIVILWKTPRNQTPVTRA